VTLTGPLVRLLASQWARYLELVISDDGTNVAVMTQGRGPEFTVQLGALFTLCEIDPVAAARMLTLSRALNHGRCFVRMCFTAGSDAPPRVSVMHRRAMHLEHGLRLIAADEQTQLELRSFAGLLQQSSVHGLVLSARAGDAQMRPAVRFARVVTGRRREAVRMRWTHAASRHAPMGSAVSCWAEHHDALLTREHPLLSMWLQPGSGMRAAEVRIEYPEVAVPSAARILDSRVAEVAARFEQLCAEAERATITHLEVILGSAALPALHACVWAA
jgi:hypothetical protein